MTKRSMSRGLALAIAGAACVVVAGAAHAQQFKRESFQQEINTNQFLKDMEGRHAADEVLRVEIAKPLNEAQALMNQPAAAAEKIAVAERERDKSPYEQYLIARVKAMLASATGDADMAAAQYEITTQGRWMTAADKTAALQTVAGLYYGKQDYKQAAFWFDRYADSGGTDATAGLLRAQSYYLVNNFAGSAKVLDAELGRTLAASRMPPEIMLKLLANSKAQIGDAEGLQKALQLLAQYYPPKRN